MKSKNFMIDLWPQKISSKMDRKVNDGLSGPSFVRSLRFTRRFGLIHLFHYNLQNNVIFFS